MAFSATKFIEEAMKYESGLCKDCKHYKTLQLQTEVQICRLSDKFLVPDFEPNRTCKKFKKRGAE